MEICKTDVFSIEIYKILIKSDTVILSQKFKKVNSLRLSGSLIRKLGSKKCDICKNVTFLDEKAISENEILVADANDTKNIFPLLLLNKVLKLLT